MADKNTADIGFEKQIWNAACVLRGNMDASEYKNVVLGLIFLKYISDRFDDKYQELVEEGDGFEEDIDEYTSEGIFFVPAGARWSEIAAKAHGFDFSNCRQISEEDYEKLRKQGCVPKKDDVLVGKDGARYFEDIIIYRQDEQPALLSSIAILRANRKKITPEFLYYTLKTPAIKKDVRDNYGSGSAIPRVVLKDFKRMPFSYPDIDEQRKITAVCSVIDAKIQVNNAINKNLAA